MKNSNLYGVLVRNRGKWAKNIYCNDWFTSLDMAKENLEGVREKSKRAKKDVKLVKIKLVKIITTLKSVK